VIRGNKALTENFLIADAIPSGGPGSSSMKNLKRKLHIRDCQKAGIASLLPSECCESEPSATKGGGRNRDHPD